MAGDRDGDSTGARDGAVAAIAAATVRSPTEHGAKQPPVDELLLWWDDSGCTGGSIKGRSSPPCEVKEKKNKSAAPSGAPIARAAFSPVWCRPQGSAGHADGSLPTQCWPAARSAAATAPQRPPLQHPPQQLPSPA